MTQHMHTHQLNIYPDTVTGDTVWVAMLVQSYGTRSRDDKTIHAM